MKLIHVNGKYVLLCSYNERMTAKDNGFKWDAQFRQWYTQEPDKALRLIELADPECRAALTGLRTKMQEAVEASKADSTTFRFEGLRLEPRPFQWAGIEYSIKNKNVIIGDEMGLGKGLTLSHVLPTIDGMGLKMSDIAVGDSVIGSNGKPTKVVGVYPQGEQVIYRVRFWDGSHVDCDGEHRWQVSDYNALRRIKKYGTPWMVKTTLELYESKITSNGHPRYHLPLCKPIRYMQVQSLPLDAYTMGVVLSEGYVGEKASEVQVTIGNADIDIVDKLVGERRIRKAAGCHQVYLRGLLPVFDRLGLRCLSKDKFIPRQYLHASVAQRTELLRGIMDGDGSCSKNRVSLSTRSLRLANHVKQLVSSLGGIAKVRKYVRDSGIDYQVNVKTEFCPFSCKRKSSAWRVPAKAQGPKRTIVSITKLPQKQETICIAVEAKDKLFVCGDDYVLTHNTAQALATVFHLQAFPFLVVCPATLKINWMREAVKFLPINEGEIVQLSGTQPEPLLMSFAKIVIINYDVLIHRATKAEKMAAAAEAARTGQKVKKGPSAGPWVAALKEMGFKSFILDESHNCSSKSKRTNSIKELASDIPIKLLLTGTPMVNKPVDLVPQLEILGRINEFGSAWAFMQRYCAPVRTNFGYDFSGASHLEELQKKLRAGIMIRRLKRDVLKELPAKQRQVIEVPSDEFHSLINEENAAWDTYQVGLAEIRAALELAKACDSDDEYHAAVQSLKDGMTAAFQEVAKLRHQTALAKVPMMIEHLKSVTADQKVVVAAHHHDVIDAIVKEFGDRCVKLDGRDGLPERQAAVDAFQNKPEIRLFVGQMRAAGVGITLTASSLVVFAEQDWTPSKVSQFEDRLHRIGQKDCVMVQHFVLERSLDARMAKVVVEKQQVFDVALDKESAAQQLEIPISLEQESATTSASRKKIALDAEKIPDDLRTMIHQCLKMLAGTDGDFARIRNDVGFSKFDVHIGHSLANAALLTPKQAALGCRLCVKYGRQLPKEIVDRCKEITKGEE